MDNKSIITVGMYTFIVKEDGRIIVDHLHEKIAEFQSWELKNLQFVIDKAKEAKEEYG